MTIGLSSVSNSPPMLMLYVDAVCTFCLKSQAKVLIIIYNNV